MGGRSTAGENSCRLFLPLPFSRTLYVTVHLFPSHTHSHALYLSLNIYVYIYIIRTYVYLHVYKYVYKNVYLLTEEIRLKMIGTPDLLDFWADLLSDGDSVYLT